MIVVDTNVVLRGLRSPQGASGFVLQGMINGEIEFAASPAVIFEYEDVLKRPNVLGSPRVVSSADLDVVLDAICQRAFVTLPQFRFRPFLDDPKDDLFVECALSAGARLIVSSDRHFWHPSLKGFGLQALSAKTFVEEVIKERRLR
jgi:putative PIN family toxin of toxin-antitoxin system